MIQDVPQESDGQESSTTPSSARTSHSHAVNYANEADVLPAEITSAPEMIDSDELQTLLVEWMETPDRATSQTYLQTHPILLTDEAERALALLDQLQPNERVRALIRGHQQLLKTSRQQGVTAAYSLLHDPEALNNTGVELMKRYWVYGRVEDLGRALQFWQEAVHLTLPTNLERPRYLSNLVGQPTNT